MSPASAGLQRRAGAAERHMRHLQSGELQEPGAGEVRALADAGRAIGQLVRIGLEVGDQFRDRLDPGRGMRRDDVRDPDHVGDRLQLVRLVGQVLEDADRRSRWGRDCRPGWCGRRPCCARPLTCRWCRRRRSGFPRSRIGPRRSADAPPAAVPSRRWSRRLPPARSGGRFRSAASRRQARARQNRRGRDGGGCRSAHGGEKIFWSRLRSLLGLLFCERA